MELRPLNIIVNLTVDEFIAGVTEPFEKQDVVDRVLQHPEIELMRKGLDVHDRSEGLERVFLRDIGRKVATRLRRNGCIAFPGGGGTYRWQPPERLPDCDR